MDTRTRVSVTQRPETSQLLEEMVEASGMSKTDLFNVGVDVLHFVWSVIRKGGSLGVRFDEDDDYQPAIMFIPGLTTNPLP
jgi:hypothetical protein